MRGITLEILEDELARGCKITKIIPYKDGGFAVTVPYHRERSGYLGKHPVDYTKREMEIPRGDFVEYSASDRVKLSFHPSGLVQFSGLNPGKIRSGVDRKTGAPKGLGLFVNPLSRPIQTGPTFVIGVWGLFDFEPITYEHSRGVVAFSEGDFYYRGCDAQT